VIASGLGGVAEVAGVARAAGGAPVTFGLRAAPGTYAGVRLWQEVRIPGDQLEMTFTGRRWSVTVPRPAVDRMEYLFELRYANGAAETTLDPANPKRVRGAFGDHSVREFPEYHPPAWLRVDAAAGTREKVTVPAPVLGGEITGQIWSPAGLAEDAAAPLLVVHDGPEYDELAALTHYAAVRLGTVRLALLSPGARNEWYSASPAYTSTLVDAVLPALRAQTRVTSLVGMGTSLGALAMLLASRTSIRSFDGLFLQSGSFFQRGLDDQERDFGRYQRIVRSVAGVLGSTGVRRPVPVVMTCGAIEENVTNNRIMARTLAVQGYDVALHEVRDVHNYTAWRDSFDPHLAGLVERVAHGCR
jgi:enterochelin esterase-like enzyme